MWNGIMHVEQVQVLKPDYIYHLAGQSRLIGLILKEGVVQSRYLMVKDILVKTLQTYRLAIGDEVYLMALTCQCHTQLCGDYTAAAIRGVANYTYFHMSKKLNSHPCSPTPRGGSKTRRD
jgi:hypothetical protein